MRFEGVFVATVTPFESNGRVSYEKLTKHLEFLADAGVHGFVPCGTTGEASTLTTEEWREVIRVTVKFAAPRNLKVISGCGGNCTWQVLERIREAKELGCDAGLVVTPYYNKPTERGLIAHFEQLAERGELPLVLYNVPSRTNVNLSLEAVTHLFKHPKIVGIKEASGNHHQWVALACATNLNEKSLLAGDDEALATIMSLGGTGTISASANVAPRLMVEIFNAAKSGNWAQAFHLQKRLFPLIQVLFKETNPAPAKYALSVLRKMEPHLRLPLVPVTPETQESIDSVLAAMEL